MNCEVDGRHRVTGGVGPKVLSHPGLGRRARELLPVDEERVGVAVVEAGTFAP